MARNFSTQTFLRKTPQELLKRYFFQKQILQDYSWPDSDWLEEITDTLERDEYSAVRLELAAIHELACDSGAELLIERARLVHGISIDEPLGLMNSHQGRAMWVFLNYYNIFQEAAQMMYIDNLANWKIAVAGRDLACNSDEDMMSELGSKIGEYFSKQGKGQHCEVDYYFRKNPDRHCFFAYPEGYLKQDIVYSQAGRRTRRTTRRAFEVVFIYEPREGLLRVYRQGRGDVRPLQDIFCKHVLALADGLPDKNTLVYDLSKLLLPSFRFSWDIADGIESVQLKMIEVGLPGAGGKRICVQCMPQEGARVVFDMIENALRSCYGSILQTTVRKAKILVKFDRQPGKRQKRFTLNIAKPNTDNLKDDPHHNIVRRLLKRWGFVRNLLKEAQAA